MALIESSAMDLPELHLHLAGFLTTSELATATRVCKSWHKSFTPFLYREIHLYHKFDYAKHPRPSVGSIEANAEHIRAVYFHAEPLDFPLEALVKVELIYLELQVGNSETWTRLATLLRQNPKLREMTVRVYGNREGFQGFMEALASSCPKLRSLEVPIALDGECARLLLDTAVRLRTLKMEGKLVFPDKMDRWPLFANLEQLELTSILGLPVELQLEMLRRSPQLKSLGWCPTPGHDISKLPGVITTHCPHLESLVLHDAFNSVDIGSILDSCQRLSKLVLSDIEFDDRAQWSLSRHYSYLVHLDLICCGTITSLMVQRVMVSCPRLDTFHAPRLDASDILGVPTMDTSDAGGSIGDQQDAKQVLHPQDWVCTSLRELTIYICGLEDKPVEWHRNVLRQLSRLTKLEDLRIGGWTGPGMSRDGLDLKSGLGVLSSLKRIQILMFDRLWQDMEEDDVRWMVEAWPRLSCVSGILSSRPKRRQQLVRILEDGGIRYMDER
ncbi:hypothetical protein B0O80DRAFT_531433 [Mortierella sp. GBAus27b]|nr:hypothetical protein BGX31_011569 [Mortierella sp. GBA43]KAI8349989.1 hypothetical protein B0O80DRAFT_531433 [Mortierella sp. GBAus27b]